MASCSCALRIRRGSCHRCAAHGAGWVPSPMFLPPHVQPSQMADAIVFPPFPSGFAHGIRWGYGRGGMTTRIETVQARKRHEAT